LAGANVFVNNIKKGTTTNINGNFALEIPQGYHEISFSHIGYETVIQNIYASGDSIKINISLKELLFNLNEVTITGTRTTHTLKENPILTQLITSDELNKQAITTIKDALDIELPGVEVQKHGFGYSMTMQGLEPQYTLILLDGERIAGESGGNIDFSK
jgi:outer membrane receptor for ferrienterochelin and colicins